MKIYIIGFFISNFLLLQGCYGEINLEKYVRDNYLMKDNNTTYNPVNKNMSRNIKKEREVTSNNEVSEILVEAKTVYPYISEDKRKYIDQFIYRKIFSTSIGDILTYNFSKNFFDGKSAEPVGNYFINSFVVRDRKGIYFPKHNISHEDIDTGGYSRELWDVFKYKSGTYILFYNRIYESHNFEIYTKVDGAIDSVLEFEFGGL